MNTPRFPSDVPSFLWHFICKWKWQFAILLLVPAARILAVNLFPYALKMLVDAMMLLDKQHSHVIDSLWKPIAMYFGVWLGWIVFFRSQEIVYVHTIPKFQAAIRMSVVEYVQQHSHQYFADHFAGSIAGKISDLPRAASALVDLVRWRIVGTLSVALAGIVMMAHIHAVFALIVAAFVVTQVGIGYFITRRVARFSAINAEDRTRLHGHVIDSLTNNSAVRLFARRQAEQSYIGGFQATEQTSNRRVLFEMWKVRLIFEWPGLAMGAGLMAAIVFGWSHGSVGLGDAVFILYSGFGILETVWQLGMELPMLFSEIGVCKQALTIVSGAHGVVDAPDAGTLKVSGGEIAFDNVHFQYRPGKDIFRDKNITIPSGQRVGLVGFSGSGKSTFVNLILRLYDVEGGRILIDGQDIAKVTQDSLRASIAMIPQDSSLFHRTLMENIRYGRMEATDEEVIEASKRAHCHEFILKLEEGYDSLVGERGIKLSGGQRQRIAIARAMLKNAPILILDEATSALDSVTEKYIQESLNTLMAGRTTIVIAHRLSTLAHLDRVLVFKDGSITEDGTHAELLAANGHYAKLWKMQAGGFLPD
ncbi:MAG TPA: ABC transporter ATP-binding protein [Rickettsiales bacterium]|nr:ABC transporter ATP-binding protein [Rickettsiales bacterium]